MRNLTRMPFEITIEYQLAILRLPIIISYTFYNNNYRWWWFVYVCQRRLHLCLNNERGLFSTTPIYLCNTWTLLLRRSDRPSSVRRRRRRRPQSPRWIWRSPTRRMSSVSGARGRRRSIAWRRGRWTAPPPPLPSSRSRCACGWGWSASRARWSASWGRCRSLAAGVRCTWRSCIRWSDANTSRSAAVAAGRSIQCVVVLGPTSAQLARFVPVSSLTIRFVCMFVWVCVCLCACVFVWCLFACLWDRFSRNSLHLTFMFVIIVLYLHFGMMQKVGFCRHEITCST